MADDSLHAAILGTSITCIILVSSFIPARLVAKKSLSSYHIEDYLLVVTWPLLLGYTIAFIISSDQGAGDHIWNVATEDFYYLNKTNYIVDIFYALTTWCGKTALLFQLQRIFAPTKTGVVHVACYILLAIIALTYSVVTLLLILQCIPISKVWDPSQSGRCLNEAAVSAATGVINVVTDFTILILPVWAIFHLSMALKRKITTSAIFGTGLIACACSLCRMFYSFEIGKNNDFTYNVAKLGISAVCEITAIILCTCFPLMVRFAQISKSAIINSRIYSLPFRRPGRSTSTKHGDKMLTDNVCLFCDEHGSCAVHGMIGDVTAGNLGSHHRLNEAPSSPSITAERRNVDTT